MVEEVGAKVVQFNVSLVPIGQVDDNPYNPRKNYTEEAIKAMAESLKANGILQVPEGRMHDGRVQLAFGHMRLRGVRLNAQGGNARWQNMPVILKELSDADMFHKTIEENLQRSDVTPLEVARAIANYSRLFPDVKEKDIAKKHGMTEANVSNMKRVLRLPSKFLDMIDEGTLTFTQGRELLTLKEFPNAEKMMNDALDTIAFGEFPDTVEGLKASIQCVIQRSPEAKAYAESIALLRTPRKKKETPSNISQEKSGLVEQAAAAVLSGAATNPEPRTGTPPTLPVTIVEVSKGIAELLGARPAAKEGTTKVKVKEKPPEQPKQSGSVTLTGDDIHDTLSRIGWWLEERAIYPYPHPQGVAEINVRILNTDIQSFMDGKWPAKPEGKTGGG